MVELKPYHFILEGVVSKHDLMHPKFGSYGEQNNFWTASEAKGFIKINANPKSSSNKSALFNDTIN